MRASVQGGRGQLRPDRIVLRIIESFSESSDSEQIWDARSGIKSKVGKAEDASHAISSPISIPILEIIIAH